MSEVIIGYVKCVICREDIPFRSETAYRFCHDIRDTYQCPKCSIKYNNVLRYIPNFHNSVVGVLNCIRCNKELKITSKNVYALGKHRGIICFECSGRGRLTYEESKAYMSVVDILTKDGWYEWCREGKRPSFIPYNPNRDYVEWRGWNDFLSVYKKVKVERYIKHCPRCNRRMEYTCKSTLTESIRRKRVCRTCRERLKK